MRNVLLPYNKIKFILDEGNNEKLQRLYIFLSLQPSGLNQVGGNLPIKRYSTNRAPATQGYCMTVVIIT